MDNRAISTSRQHTPTAEPVPATAVLELRHLKTAFPGRAVPTVVVNDVSLALARGETLAVVGESGSGKTMTFLSALGLLPSGGRVIGGEAILNGTDLLSLSPRQLRSLRGPEISMVFQDPLSGLNPVFRIGEQIIDAIRAHRDMSRREARAEAIRLLERVQIPDPARRINNFPHELSGGMRQRALIAMAIALDPAVLIADEPTTALDVTIQAQILELLAELQAETGMGLVLITHDLGLVARHADRVAVMYGGRVVEQSDRDDIFKRTRHPYTVSLFRSIPHLHTPADAELTPIEGLPPDPAALPTGCAFEPRCYLGHGRTDCQTRVPRLAPTDADHHLSACHHWREVAAPDVEHAPAVRQDDQAAVGKERESGDVLVDLRNVTKTFASSSFWGSRSNKGAVTAVDGVSLVIRRGETLGLVGETGSGKSTIGRVILRLEDPSSGEILFRGSDIAIAGSREVRRQRQHMQMVFQDPYGSLDPRMTVGQLIAEPMIVHGVPRAQIAGRMEKILDQVGLARDMAVRYPHEFSGGQRQRIGVARALVLEPDLLILDEPVSALDVSIQAQILNMLRRIQSETGIAYLFIAHDLAVVRHISDRVGVLYLGRIVETAPRDDIYSNPRHPYTISLLSAVPVPDPDLERERKRVDLHGEISSGIAIPSGCRFHPRCFRARAIAARGRDQTVQVGDEALPRACVEVDPTLQQAGTDTAAQHETACHYPVARAELPAVMGTLASG